MKLKGAQWRKVWAEIGESGVKELSVEKVAELLAEAREVDAANRESIKQHQEAAKKWLEQGRELYDNRSFKKIERIPMIQFNTSEESTGEWNLIGRFKPEREKLAAERKAANIASEQTKTLNEAISYLIGKGKLFGRDFDAANAVKVANEIAFDDAIEYAMPEDGKYIDFEGMNDMCEENGCMGWDGVSHRCNCCHRRVSWESYGDFRGMTAHGCAH